MTPSLFPLLKTGAALGRTFAESARTDAAIEKVDPTHAREERRTT